MSLWGFVSAREVVMRFGVTLRHKSAYDSHWRSLVGAVSSLCIARFDSPPGLLQPIA